MEARELAIKGAWELIPRQFGDARGVFLETYKEGVFNEFAGHSLHLAQANCSVSAAGVIRGIHFAQLPPSQAKYVMCPRGAVLDIVVDVRVGSPTFGQWDSVLLDDVDRRAIYISQGLGHAFCALEDASTVMYLCSDPYAPGREFGINPLCPEVGIKWPDFDRAGRPLEVLLSDKDTCAPNLSQALDEGLLPNYEDVLKYTSSL